MQQVNLYKHLEQKQEIPASALHIAYASAGMLALTLLFSGIVALQNMSLDKQISQTKAQDELLKSQTDSGQNAKVAKLAKKTESLQKEFVEQQAVLKALEQSKREGKDIFSNQLAGLGRQHIKGLWLNRIEFNFGGTQVSLAGEAKTPALLPRYLQALGEEESFKGLRFDLMKMEAKDTGSHLSFEVSVKPDTSEKKT